MDRATVKFVFKDSVPMPEVEATLRLALLAVESLHGEDRLCLESPAKVDRARRICSVDMSTDIGRTLATIFGGYIRREFGADAVKVEQSPQAVEAT